MFNSKFLRIFNFFKFLQFIHTNSLGGFDLKKLSKCWVLSHKCFVKTLRGWACLCLTYVQLNETRSNPDHLVDLLISFKINSVCMCVFVHFRYVQNVLI